MGSDKHPNDTPGTPMLIPGKVEDFVNKYIAPTWNGVAKQMGLQRRQDNGRTSGKAYETPVSLSCKGDVLAIGLMYRAFNWAKNALAAGEADVKLPKGKVVHITNPRTPSAATP